MKQRWMRRVAVVLVLCLLFNDNLTGVFMRTQAVEKNASVASFGVSGNDVVSLEDIAAEEKRKAMEDERAEKLSKVEEVPEPEITEEMPVTTKTPAPSEWMDRSKDKVEWVDKTKEPGKTVEESQGTGETASADETMKEELVPGLNVAPEDIAVETADNQYTMPEDVATYQAAIEAGRKEFYIATAQDYINAQNLSSSVDFAGITLTILEPSNTNRTWDISSITGFTGIGTAAYPFKGSLRCFYENGEGVRFTTDKPLLAYMGDGAAFSQLDMTVNGSVAAIAQNISGNVTISDVWIQGTIGSGTGTVGTIASEIASNSTVTLSAVKATAGALTVSGAIAGGIAGSIGDNVTVTLASDVDIAKTAEIEVTATEAAGGCFGVVRGSHTWNLADTNLTNAKVKSAANTCYAGQFAGQLLSDNGSGTLTVIGGNSLEADVSGTGNSGGLVGLCGEGTKLVAPTGGLTISGKSDSSSGISGGVAGVIVNSQMELADYTVTARVGGSYAGGIVGQIQGGKYIIRNVSVAEVTGPSATGGVVAQVSNGAAIELQGKITLTGVSPHGNGSNGFVAGKQDGCLIYLSEVEGLIDGVSQLSFVYDNREDIGTYGGLYRNQSIGGGKLIGDGTLANVGVINNTVSKTGDWYQLKSVADFETLAIVLGTNGAFGSNAFGGANWTELLGASYTVTTDVDISYDKTGIVTLNRNDQSESATYAFSGKLKGAYDAVTITKSSDNAQYRMGLFSSVTLTTEFSDLVLAGTVQNAKGYGGIAYEHIGSGTTHGMTLDNITIQQSLSGNSGWVGGVLARKTNGGSYTLKATDITLNTTLQASGNNFSGFITYMTNADVIIDGISIGGSITSTDTGDVGGFLGRTWNTIGGTVKNITVQDGTQYTAAGYFGALWNYVSNHASAGEHLTLDTVKLDGLTVNASASVPNCGLLFQDATNLIANIVDYDSTGCVVNTPGTNFDEVAGVTRNNPNRVGAELPLPATSGIISLHSSDAYFPTYHYENKVESLKGRTNGSSMYYYDLFQYLENEDGTVNTANQINYNVLDTPAKVLLWNVLQMAPGGLRDTFKPYFVNGTYQLAHAQTYYFKGTLDLSNISYYPTPNVTTGTYIGQEDARIIFGAKTDSVDMGTWSIGNETVWSQHFGLQGGLLYNDYGNMSLTVQDITFAGTIANLDFRSGVILAGEVGLADGGTFQNITLDNLWIADYNGTNGRVGLLIANLPANTVNFEGIKMINYPSNSDAKAAAALVGYAGGTYVTNMVLNFSDMAIADDVNNNASVNHNSDVLAYASFIYEYDYTDNTEINTGSGIYLFSEEDATSGNVTYGKELDESTEFSDNSKTVLSTMGISNTNYKPYVYIYETIQVNPKAGDILKGCGTYDDPYIIEDEKQFLTLYRYINERELTTAYPTYQYDSFYKQGGGWKIVRLGDDTSFCTEKHVAVWDSSAGDYNVEVVAYGDTNFPTPEQLCHAYYMLAADLDLTSLNNETYKQIADDFVGFGTDTRPFAGVWYGAGHSITLPEKVSKTYTNYGFIQYAQGAVIKDITLKSVQNSTIDASNAPFVNGSGGGVIATVLGGDNIIDNVTVAMDIKLQDQHSPVGGYVGIVKKGGVILRNVETADLSQFRMNQAYSSDVFCLLGAVVGKVEDGYVLYEGAGAGSVQWTGISTLNGYPAAPGYAILNGDTLLQSGLDVGAPTLSDSIYYDITVSIPDATGLQIMAMALNADALNVKPSDYSSYTACGYTEKSRSRKADYNSIGHTAITDDYVKAAKYDNVMGYNENANKAYAYPFLYDYMGITGDDYLNYLLEDDGGYTILNPYKPIAGKIPRITWELASNGSYDMAQFGDAFRGIGAIYQTGNSHGGTFHGNFYGNNSTITLAMTRKVLPTEIYSETIPRVGLFNTIYGSYTSMYNIPADFSESVVSDGSGDGGDTGGGDSGGSGDGDNTGGGGDSGGGDTGDTSDIPEWDENTKYHEGDLVLYEGNVYRCVYEGIWYWLPTTAGYWELVTETATLNAETVEAEVPDVVYADSDTVNCFEIKDFKLAGTIDGVGQYRVLAGGVAACVEAGNYIFSNISMDTTNPLSIGTVNNKANVFGGVIGWLGGSSNVLIRDCRLVGTEGTPVILKGAGNGGGLVGNNYGTLKIETAKADYLQINSSNNGGGLVGYTLYGKTICVGTEETPISITNSTIAGGVTGGLVGNAGATVSVRYAESLSNDIGTTSSVESTGGIVGCASTNITIADVKCDDLTMYSYCNIGGVVGKTTGTGESTIQNVTITDSVLQEQSNYNGQPEGIGGIVGLNEQTLTINNVQVTGTKTGDSLNFRIAGSEQVRTNIQGVGGIVGYHITETRVLTLKDCAVNTVDISTDIRVTGSYVGQALGVGGIVGFVAGEVVLAPEGKITIENLNVKAPLISEVGDVAVMGAGGAFGIVWYKYNMYYAMVWGGDGSTYYDGMTASNNTVNGKYAGGLIGYSNLAQVRLSGATVKDGSVVGDDAVGGLIGYLLPSYQGAAFNPNEGDVAVEPVNVVSGMNITGKTVGGAIGYFKLHGPGRLESVEITGNVIRSSVDMSERLVGGFIGACEATSVHKASFYDITVANNTIVAEVAGSTLNASTEVDLLAVGGVIGKTVANDSASMGDFNFDGIYVASSNRIGARVNNTDSVQLIKKDGTTYRLADVAMPVVGENVATDIQALDALEQDYGYFIGAFVGVWESASMQMYVLDEKEENGKFVPPVMETNPPVVDVGRNTSQGVDDYRTYCHIIYGAENSVAADVEKNLADMKAEVERVSSEYTGAETYGELLTELRIPASAVELFNLSYVDSYQFPGTELKIEFPMLVYRVQNGTLQDMMESVTDVMTNMAGNSASDVNILSIKATPKLFDGTNFTNGTTASISATIADGIATYTMEEHDGVTDNKLSYTELTFTYQTKSDHSGQHKKVFVLPVFVEEPILYSVHSKIMEGKVSDVSTIRANGTSEENNNIIMANDSDYTLLLEYTYGEARKQMVDGVSVDKMFYLKQNDTAKSLPLGTQLLLVDVTGGNKAYYYTVTDEDVTVIRFTDFKDSRGINPYENQSINNLPDATDEGQDSYTDLGGHSLTETAVERYLLTVFSNDSDTKSKVYSIHAGILLDDENLASRFQLEKEHNAETVWNITANPGLEVSLINKGNDTDISGVISKTDTLTIKAAFALTAQDVYWAQKSREDVTVIDSSNSDKYLEIAFYLRDGSGNRVALPDGTNFSYLLGDGTYSGNRVIPDDSMVYYYKDIRNQFGIENFEYQISDISQNTTVPIEYVLDFSGADLSTILDDTYVAWIELLRTANKDYPMGNGNEVDNYSKTINANAMQELGFALLADKLESLAINTYPTPADENKIPGHIMFDFSENLNIAGNGAGRDMVLEKWSGLEYEVTYQLYKKTASGYKPYSVQQGEEIPIEISATDQIGIEKSSKTGSLTVTYNFTSGQIESGNGEEPVEGVLSFPCLITLDTAQLVAETDSLTNYRLEATLSIKEKGVIGDVAEKTTDFFVYTVTKLKFDL